MPADAALLSRVGGISLLESHGHSAPGGTMQAYVDKSFSEETCKAELLDENNIFTAAFYKNAAAGYSKIILATPHPAVDLKPVTKLERLYLLKEYYGFKLGHHLLEQAIGFSKEKEQKGMWLEVWKGNSRAVGFYEKQGFQTIGETAFRLTDTHANPAWVMLARY